MEGSIYLWEWENIHYSLMLHLSCVIMKWGLLQKCFLDNWSLPYYYQAFFFFQKNLGLKSICLCKIHQIILLLKHRDPSFDDSESLWRPATTAMGGGTQGPPWGLRSHVVEPFIKLPGDLMQHPSTLLSLLLSVHLMLVGTLLPSLTDVLSPTTSRLIHVLLYIVK